MERHKASFDLRSVAKAIVWSLSLTYRLHRAGFLDRAAIEVFNRCLPHERANDAIDRRKSDDRYVHI